MNITPVYVFPAGLSESEAIRTGAALSVCTKCVQDQTKDFDVLSYEEEGLVSCRIHGIMKFPDLNTAEI